MATEMTKIIDIVEKLLDKSTKVEVDMNDSRIVDVLPNLQKAKVRLELSRSLGIVVDFPQGANTVLTIHRAGKTGASAPTSSIPEKQAKIPVSAVPVKKHQHTYVVPKLAKDMLSVMTDAASHIIWLTGPTQCGKDRVVHFCGRELGRKVYQINCRGDMGSEIFFGEKTIVIDEATKQNKIVFQKGVVEQACLEGLDENGNEIGQPAILFITEAASMPARVAIAINRLLESDDARRTLIIDQDGGRVVRSHSGLRIVFAANTTGRGAMSMEASAYSAQTDALDISLINRVAVCFRMGYDREVERHICIEKIGDDRVANKILQFRDAIRQQIKEGKLTSPFSTAHIVHIADMYRIFGDLGKAIYYVVFEFLMPEEKAIYNEKAVLLIGKDLLKEFTASDVDYM